VLERRIVQQADPGEPVHHVLIQWEDGRPEAGTWEDLATIKYHFARGG